jgi:PAS domain S-box-containing protein
MGGKVIAAVAINTDITDHKTAEQALLQREERERFLLKLSDALRPLGDVHSIEQTLTRLVGEQLGADWVVYGHIEEDNNIVDIGRGYQRQGVPPIAGVLPLSSFGWALPTYRKGITLLVHDTQTSELVPVADREACAALGMIALISVPLIKDGELVGALAVSQATPRVWTQAETVLAEQSAERIWAIMQRARSDDRLRASEQRFQQFANASSDVLWIRNAEDLSMEFVSPSFQTTYGVALAEVMGDIRRWAARIVPDDRHAALAALKQVRNGKAVVHEFRIQRASDGAFRWIRNTDFPLHNDNGEVQRVAGIATDITDERLSVQHHRILLDELQHRVRNIMAMITSVTARTADTAASVEDYASLLTRRLAAMARTQLLLTHAVNNRVEINTLIRNELATQAHHEGQYELSGPEVTVSPKAAEVLTLAVHELATNALKYGALASKNGKITVNWRFVQAHGHLRLRLTWSEKRSPMQGWQPATRRGFGTILIEERVPYELSGEAKVEITPEGAQAWIEFPLQDGASILETGSPVLTAISGGSTDMSSTPLLSGKRVLVVEDDFYLASDLAAVLRNSGAQVVGPFSTESQAIEAAMAASIDAAVLDINLGPGPSFAAAGAVKDAGVPYLFLTGYDTSIIPAEFKLVPVVGKPANLRMVVQELARALQAR